MLAAERHKNSNLMHKYGCEPAFAHPYLLSIQFPPSFSCVVEGREEAKFRVVGSSYRVLSLAAPIHSLPPFAQIVPSAKRPTNSLRDI